MGRFTFASRTFAMFIFSRFFCSIAVLFVFVGFDLSVFGQTIPLELNAVRCAESPKVNGTLDDACWSIAPIASDFIVLNPTPGAVPRHRTEVQVVYDDEAVYIAFMCFDSQPDSILQQLSGRDGDGNSDYCGITFSCYRDGITGFTFAVGPTAEQWDARETNGGEVDISWNAVWNCHTSIVANGWIAEYKIPFSALRFPEAEEQVWNINFFREIRRYREQAFWNRVEPTGPGNMVQMGQLKGIKGIEPPTRLFFTPYASTYADFTENSDGSVTRSQSYNGGLDVKLGLNDAFTLDATLIPDFGQTISDQLILNLTPFEIQFQDNRQFFLEGTEIFNRGGIFYSRRVGDIPVGYFNVYSQLQEGEEVIENPAQTQLINATKISGRNKNGLGIGVFNAVTAASHARVRRADGSEYEVETGPMSNYNMLVFDQNLKNNSYFALANSNVMRNGTTYDANVTAIDFNLKNKSNSYAIGGSGAYNLLKGVGAGGDNNSNDGFTSTVFIQKIKGNFIGDIGSWVESDDYNPNDFGFLQANNSFGQWLNMAYNIYEPFWKLNRLWTNAFISYERLYNPNTFTGFSISMSGGVNDRHFHSYGYELYAEPIRGYDYFEPRVEGRYFRTFRQFQYGGWISTDYRRKLAIDIGSWATTYENDGRNRFNWRVSPRFRFNDHLMIIYVYSQQNHYNDLGFATMHDQIDNEPVFGKRDVVSHTNVLTLAYAFNPLMTLNCRVRHYWGFSKYKEFYGLGEDGELIATDYSGFVDPSTVDEPISGSLADRNFNSFTVDLFYRWIFTPGSELVLGWKNAIIAGDRNVPQNLLEDMEYTFTLPQSNSLSLRVIYFVDYRSLQRKNKA